MFRSECRPGAIKDCGEISKGAMIGCSPILDRDIFNALTESAKTQDLIIKSRL